MLLFYVLFSPLTYLKFQAVFLSWFLFECTLRTVIKTVSLISVTFSRHICWECVERFHQHNTWVPPARGQHYQTVAEGIFHCEVGQIFALDVLALLRNIRDWLKLA